MLEIFTNSKYDSNIAVTYDDKTYTYKELTNLIAYNAECLKNKKENIVLCNCDNFKFIINFLSSVFAEKNIYLLTDKTKLRLLDFEYDLLDDFHNQTNNNYVFKSINPSEVYITFFSSGSSGKPKMIKKTLQNLISEADDLGNEFQPDKKLTVLSTTTMCHLFGLTFQLMYPLCNKLTINANQITYPENINTNNSILVSTPSFLATKAKHNLDFGIAPYCIISAGSKLGAECYKAIEDKSKIIEIYGSTESGIIGYKTKYDEPFKKFKNVTIESNIDCTTVKSNYIYDGTVKINDSISVSGETFTIKGRTDRLFKIYDKRVSADELENELNKNKLVQNSYMFENNGKLACLCALSEQGKKFLIENNILKLTKILKTHISDISEIIPQKWKFTDSIPMTITGKIDKNIIEHMFNIKLSLPTILSRTVEENSITYELFIYKNCNFFKGHFPKYMIMPGVAQIYLAKELAIYNFKTDLSKGQLKRIKFINVIKPNSIIRLKLTKQEKFITFEYFNDEQKYSSGDFATDNSFYM